MLIQTSLAHQGHGFAQGLDHRGNQKISAELDQIRVGRIVAEAKSLLPDGLEQRHAGVNRIRGAGYGDEELGRSRRLGPAKYRG